MPDDTDPYRVLGLPVGASKRDIQKRYRKLLRTHHPDVSDDPKRAHDSAAEIGRAYRILMDDDRRAAFEESFFRGADPQIQVIVERADPARSPVPGLLQQATGLLARRRWDEVQLVCAEILTHDQDCAQAYEILGHTFEQMGRHDLSREMYQEAQRLAGIGPAPFRQAYARPHATPAPPRAAGSRRHIWTPGPTRPLLLLDIASALLAAGAIAVAAALGGPLLPLLGIALYPFLLAALAAFVIALGLAASGRMRTFDQELGVTIEGGRLSIPLWPLIFAAACLSGFLAAAAHIITAALSDSLSATCLGFWAIIAALCLLALALLDATPAFLWLGLNALSLAALTGWAVGSTFSPREWWR